MLHRPQLPSTSFHHIQSLLNVLVCYFESVTCKRNTPTGEQFIFLCCPNARIARGLVKQQTSTPSASACQPSANVPLFTSSVQTCCPIQWHGVERPSCVLQDTWQPARQSVPPPPKCRAHFPSKRFFLTALAFMFSTHNWCSCWKEKVDIFFPKFTFNSSVLLLL